MNSDSQSTASAENGQPGQAHEHGGMARLSRSELEYAAELLNGITDGFFSLSASWCFTYLNRRAEEILAPLRLGKENLIGRDIWAELPGLLGTPVEAFYRRAMGERVMLDFETFYAPLGHWFFVRLYPAREGLSASFQDITARKEAEKTLMQQREWFAVTLASIGDAVITTDVQSTITFLNPPAEKLTGWSSANAINQPLEKVLKIVSEKTLLPASNPITQALREGVVVSLAEHTALIAKNGTETAIEDSAAPIRDAEGKVIGAVMVFHDVTARRQAEKSLFEQGRLTALRADISSALVSGDTLRNVLQQCARALVTHLDGAFARVWTLNESENVLELQASAGLYTHLDGPHGKVKVGEFKIGRIAQSARPHLTNDVLHDVNISDPEWARREGMTAFAGYPMMLDGRVLGVMALFARHSLSEAVLGELSLVCDGISQWVQRRHAEEALRESEKFNRSVLESSPDCLKILNSEGRLQHMNTNGMRLLEIDDITPLINRPWWEFCGEESASAIKQAVERAIGGEITRIQAPCPTIKGTQKWWDVIVSPVAGEDWNDKSARIIAVSRDITDIKLAEEEQRASEARFRAIVSQATTGVAQADGQGRLTLVNQRWCKMLGYSESEFLGTMAIEFTHPDDRARTLEAMKGLAEGGSSFVIEKRYLRKDGSIFWGSSSVNAVRGSAGEFQGFVAVVLDITEWRAAENSLRLAKEQAEAGSRAKDNFLAALSHELRTPLTPVLMTAAALRDDERLPIDVREQLGMMERNIALEARLIDDLLDLTRISTGKLKLREELCDAHTLISLAVGIVRNEAQSKPVSLALDLAARSSGLHGDPARLQQVFWNLLRNAIKFTPVGGKVCIRTCNTPDNRLRIEVIDTGIGIDPESLDAVFHPFEQAAREGDHRFGGLGLGLAIARAIVDLHGGVIRAESGGPGLGATFVVELPHATEQRTGATDSPHNHAAEPRDDAKALPCLRLLLIEDHEPTLAVLSRLLTRAGHQVVGASTVAAALAAAGVSSFDLVISDLGLPDGTGVEALGKLRLIQPGLPGIALSGYGMEEDLQRSLDAGFSTHLIKPIDFDQLRRALKDVVTRGNFVNREFMDA